MSKNKKHHHNIHHHSSNGRPTIGFLTYGLEDRTPDSIWTGIVDAAQRQDVNLISFVGQQLRNPNGFLAQANVLYDLVSPKSLDGLIVWTSIIGNYIEWQETVSFIKGYHPLPLVSLGAVVEGIPSIIVEGYQGVRELMIHLIEVHGHRRLAFIRGPEIHPYAQARYRAYVDTLAEYNLPFDPNLVTPPNDWDQTTGYKMTQLLLDQRKLQPQIDLDVVIAASDIVALGALAALQRRGINVPAEVGVVGFNDSLEGRAVTPPLTSVRGPFYQQGEQALKTVLSMLAGEPVLEQVILPTQLIVRQSCGCADTVVEQAKIKRIAPYKNSVPALSVEEPLDLRQERLLSEVMLVIRQTGIEDIPLNRAEQLIQAFAVDITYPTTDTFLSTLEAILIQATTVGLNACGWQNVISILRRHSLSFTNNDETLFRIENLTHQARVIINQISQRTQLHQEILAKQYTNTLRRIAQALLATFDLDRLRDVLIREFPALDIPSCYLCLYENPQTPAEMAQLILSYRHNEQNRLEERGFRFPSKQLAPRDILAREKRYSMVVEALYFEKTQLGFALFEMGPIDGFTYATLRGQISSALYGALLLQQVQEHARQLDIAVSETQATVKELEAFSYSVSHDLRAPLRSIDGYSQVLLEDYDNVLDATGQDYLQRVRKASQRMGQLIDDLLSLSRITRQEIRREVVDLSRLAREIVAELRQTEPERAIECSIADEIIVTGDPDLLRIVLNNLISNAWKFTGNRTPAKVQIYETVQEQEHRYIIKDNGDGFDMQYADKLFAPFQRLHQQNEFEGTGIGLATVQRIVQRHGGRIWAESKPDHGASFFFTLN